MTGVNPDSIAKAQAELGSEVPVLRADSASVAAQKALAQTVSPGPVQTPLYDKLGIPDAYREQVNKDIAATIPLGRFGTSEEVTKAVQYLASDESRWTVGSEIVVDGGRLLKR